VIPLLTDSTMDKISLFQCAKPKKGFPPFEKRKAFAAEIAKRLPALAAFIDRFEIPESMRTSEEAWSYDPDIAVIDMNKGTRLRVLENGYFRRV
jgi:hypothetical protein